MKRCSARTAVRCCRVCSSAATWCSLRTHASSSERISAFIAARSALAWETRSSATSGAKQSATSAVSPRKMPRDSLTSETSAVIWLK